MINWSMKIWDYGYAVSCSDNSWKRWNYGRDFMLIKGNIKYIELKTFSTPRMTAKAAALIFISNIINKSRVVKKMLEKVFEMLDNFVWSILISSLTHSFQAIMSTRINFPHSLLGIFWFWKTVQSLQYPIWVGHRTRGLFFQSFGRRDILKRQKFSEDGLFH